MQKPQIKRSDVESILRHFGVEDKAALVGIRGYFLDSFGKKGENDRGVYDDAIIVITPTHFETFTANTDPSVFRKGIATLKPGVHRYYKGKHKGRYWALRLVGETATVTRDGQTGDKVGVALNIHKGGGRTTGSEGCQTIQPNDWDDFIELVYDEMDRYKQETIPYVLVEEKARRQGTVLTPPVIKSRPVDTVAAPDVQANPSPVLPTPSPVIEAPQPVMATLEVAESEFKPEPFTAYIPQIDTAKSWLKTVSGLLGLGSAGAFFGGLPQWLVICLFVLLALVVLGGIIVVIRYHERIFAYVTEMNRLRATPGFHNPKVSAEEPPK